MFRLVILGSGRTCPDVTSFGFQTITETRLSLTGKTDAHRSGICSPLFFNTNPELVIGGFDGPEE
jgi:hypothetical protein